MISFGLTSQHKYLSLVKNKQNKKKQKTQANEKLSLAKALVFGSATGVCWTLDKMCHFNLDKHKCEQGVSC